MTSPHPPHSYYSISSDYSPTQAFDEDGDSFTSFGSIETPPRLRAMIRSIFDGTLNSPIRSFPDSDYGDASSPLERVTDHLSAAIVEEGMNEGETFGDYRARLLASIPPLPLDGAAMVYSSNQDGEYELDDSVVAPTPHTDQEHYTAVVGSPAPASLGYVPDATNEVGQDVGLLDPNDNGVFPVDPRLQLPSEDDDRSTIDSVFSLLDPYEDPTDTTYVPPKKSKQSRVGRKRSSGSLLAKPKAAFVRPRDSRGRFVSLQSRNPGKLKANDNDDQPLPSSSSSSFLHRAVADSNHPYLAETARNTFLNTVLTSPEEAFPFTFHLPDPFAAHSSLAGPSVLGTHPFIPPTPFINIRPDDPRLQFRTAFVDLLRVIVPFLSNFNLAPDDHDNFKLLSHAVVAAQDCPDVADHQLQFDQY
ncbi:uncharacterized protein PGTG_09526 [Puccinia graminis f. sp. tritici CRL 75-36-700-3]|uniref:Uncharacterized protein n=1 Tax=Puccinia graminis f. sp. tritici (strain CRL 75-36-700-3 / race SCCL) TaxID=418459 RepID=E3KHN8_PUCGT|nr:uncharacterized protein PGTG_09526 [Puccinia graminis f. sp. tritici CRL 75-36-700-3]EFP83813.2 hypothetical protein PGTG_09526 [Puccinia graminis f. sp. tritici CRL 75-36-700-3]